MKILLTATVQSHICQFHKPLVAMLHKYNCEVHVAARNNLAEKNGLKLDFVDKVYDIPFARSPKSKDNLRAYKELKKIIDRGQYDVVHCNTPMGGIVTRLAARKAREKGTKVYYTAHGFHFYKGAPKKNWLIFYPIEKIFSRITDKLITITEEDYKLAVNKFKCPTYHLHGVGIKTKKFDDITKTQVKEFRDKKNWIDDFLILCVGELNQNKNQTVIIKAMPTILKEVPKAKLLLAGNGPWRYKLEQLIDELNLKTKVELLGYRTDIEWYIHSCDIVVTASRREGLPVNVLEAMYCKKPVVASNNRGHRELIKNGETGYIVEINNANMFAQRIIEIFKDNEKCQEFIENNAKNIILYTDRNVQMELEKLYEFID